VQFVAFVLLICFISSWSKDTPVAITGAGMIALGLIFLWAVNQLPVLLYVLFLLILLCGTFAYMIPEILKLEEKKFMPFYEIYFYLWSNFRVSFALLSVGMLLIACAYFPRRLELKRYFGIYPIRKVPVPPERKFGGFTLIEILICIAIIGIITGGILSGWRYCLHQQRELYHRVQIQEILSSELNEILTGKEIPPVGTEVRDLPISLSAFGEQPDLSGGYTVSETDEEGIVRIQVALTQYMENSVSRRFELVGYRHIARGES